MIRCANSTVQFEGTHEKLCAEMVQVLRCFKNVLVANIGPERAEKMFSMVVEDSQKTPEELKAEIERTLREKFGEFGEMLVAFLGKAGNDNGIK